MLPQSQQNIILFELLQHKISFVRYVFFNFLSDLKSTIIKIGIPSKTHSYIKNANNVILFHDTLIEIPIATHLKIW